ncbi:MAG: hypothetical protein ACRDSE_20220, partial [Pseudonocardiaceae bacterium]
MVARRLRSLLARWLERLAAAVRPGPENAQAPQPGISAGPGSGNEHWLSVVRGRAPELLAGGGIRAGVAEESQGGPQWPDRPIRRAAVPRFDAARAARAAAGPRWQRVRLVPTRITRRLVEVRRPPATFPRGIVEPQRRAVTFDGGSPPATVPRGIVAPQRPDEMSARVDAGPESYAEARPVRHEPPEFPRDRGVRDAGEVL